MVEERGVELEEAMGMEEKLQETADTYKKKGRKGKKGRMKQSKKKKDGGIGEYKLVNYEDLPDYMKENEFIRKYYRSEWPISQAFLSLFSWHNETLNVWTHLIGFLLFLGLTLMHLSDMPQVADLIGHLHGSFSSKAVENVSLNQGTLFSMAAPTNNHDHHHPDIFSVQHRPSTSAAPRWPFLVFLSGSMLCLITSSLCHLLCCHSHRLNLILSRLDYAGIAVMIATSFFPPISYAFLCAPRWRYFYLSSISFLAVLTVMSLLTPKFTHGSYRAFRALLFSAMGLTGIVPAVHITVVNWSEARRMETMVSEAAMAAFYLVGTGFYVSRVPERWRPGKFDMAGHSHQIFHVFVLAGAMAHYVAALLFLEWRDAVGCGRSS
ncbi:heptahelical transmembrane protein ADIPOR1 [Phalaenopsis equestris]|uniref:heptahelical transmembrane protein ADIPOR1 n=1 Tax=Phalaenopsis equestris TaxID=78828 RepID=UPI0009E1F07A|nr:heptahelical transmembrane protein ADIPOR1 [Phalaenopsis equestris]XP_020590019.1 heptahelical transmembrane protein ADIPOR1 [Phalaenopsis equestris]XP_020590021.1 heptahelical transmembrane protein ADIPOR1 [Phalaenopsis equestris]